MDYTLRKDDFCNWHFDGVIAGSKREQRICRHLSRHYFDVELIANTPNMLVDAVVRIRTPKWSNLPILMEHCKEIVFWELDGVVYFFFDKPHD